MAARIAVHQKAVDLFLQQDRRLAHASGKLQRGIGGLFRRVRPLHDLDQFHHQGRVEEVHVAHLLRAIRHVGQPRADDEGAVGRQDRVGGTHRVQPFEQVTLDVELLGDRFDNEIGVPRGQLQVRGERDVSAGLPRSLLGQPSLDDAFGKVGVGEMLCLLEDLRDGVGARHRVACQRPDQGDLVSHVACADHADALDTCCFHSSPHSMGGQSASA